MKSDFKIIDNLPEKDLYKWGGWFSNQFKKFIYVEFYSGLHFLTMDIRNFFGKRNGQNSVGGENVAVMKTKETDPEKATAKGTDLNELKTNDEDPTITATNSSQKRKKLIIEDDEDEEDDEITTAKKKTTEIGVLKENSLNVPLETGKNDQQEISKGSIKATPSPSTTLSSTATVASNEGSTGSIQLNGKFPRDLQDFIKWNVGDEVPYNALVDTFEAISHVSAYNLWLVLLQLSVSSALR